MEVPCRSWGLKLWNSEACVYDLVAQPMRGADGEQPFSSLTIRASVAAGPRRSRTSLGSLETVAMMIRDYMLADIQTWQFPVVLLEFIIMFAAVGCGIYFFIKWTGKK